MIVWLNQLPRLASAAKPLNRVGFLKDKNYAIHRSFDHIAFSLFTGKVQVSLTDQDGKTLIDRPGCVLALPGDVRKLVPLRPVDEFFFVYEAEHLSSLFPEEESKRNPHRARTIPLTDAPAAAEYAELMKRLLAAPLSPARCTQLDLLAEAILAETFLNHPSPPSPSAADIFHEIENHLQRHYHDDLDWEKVASERGVSYSAFRQWWRTRHAVSPHASVMELRNREARELLKDHSLAISRIAELVGYDDPRYFARFFRKLNGVTPTEYRRMQQK